MINNNIMYALGKAMAKYARDLVINDTTIDTNQIIDLAPLLVQWKPNHYNVGDIAVYNNCPYKCIMEHDSTNNEQWNPVDAASLWANYHGTDVKHALPYTQPTGAHDAYMQDEYMVWNEYIYKSVINNNIYNPEQYPSGWEFIEEI